MRTYRLILCLVPVVAGCQSMSSSTSLTGGAYQEDLSVHRPVLPIPPDEEVSQVVMSTSAVVPTGHISELMDSINAILTARNANARFERGYTIQVYNGASRSEANSILGRLRVGFPDLDSRVDYFQPDYKVMSGFFRHRLDAYAAYEDVKSRFPRAMLVPTQREADD